MTDAIVADTYGRLIGPDTIQIQRSLPGPIERLWSYLVDSDLRRQWLADGEIRPESGEKFELVWRNDERPGAAGERPEDVGEVHRMDGEVIEAMPPTRLVISWQNTGHVTFALEPHGDDVLLTVTHAGFRTRSSLIGHSAGWHAHLDSLLEVSNGTRPQSFWKHLETLRADYDTLYPQDFGA